MADLEFEHRYKGYIAGIDEAGRGPWAGPVIASATIITDVSLLAGVNDSKKLTPSKRETFYELITSTQLVGIGIASVAEIDQHNILQATFMAMQRAVHDLPITPDHLLIDGNQSPHIPIPETLITKGDSISLSIAAASIIAKVTRDRLMQALAKEYPGYGWDTNAGYGTKLHQEGLKNLGITPYHRKSFAPIKALLLDTLS